MENLKRAKVNSEVAHMLKCRYRDYCVANDLEMTYEGFFEFMMALSIIPERRVLWYFIIRKYPEYLQSEKRKTRAIVKISEIVPLSERQLWNIFSQKTGFFRKKKEIQFFDSHLIRK